MSVMLQKIPWWIKRAKEILSENPSAVVCLNDKDLFHYINDQVPLTNKVSYDYFRKLLNENYVRKSNWSFDTEHNAEELRKVWRTAKINNHVNLYSNMMANDKSWLRDFRVLERRFKDSWAEHKEETENNENEIFIKMIKDEN